jgi:steroid delta-isomerase-like uncharacterized protein
MAKDKRQLVNEYFDALTKQDWQRFRATLSDESAYEEEATHRRLDNPDDGVEVAKAWMRAFPDLKAEVKELIVSGDAAVVELVWRGTHTGQLTAPFGTIGATSKRAEVPAMMLLRFDGDRIGEVRHYFDLLTLLAQLGIAPQPAPRPAASK